MSYPLFPRRRGLFDNPMMDFEVTGQAPGTEIFAPPAEVGMRPEDFMDLRMQQFNPSQMNVNTPFAQDDIGQLLSQLYSPETEITERYKRALLDEMPVREKPGKLRRLGGILAGLSGDPRAAEGVAYGPYLSKMADWEKKVGALEKGASQERLSNINERTLATTMIGRELEGKRIATSEREAQSRITKREEDVRLAEQKQKDLHEARMIRAKAYDFRQRNPLHKMTENEKGELILVDPGDGTIIMPVDDDGNPIKTGNLSDTDKINLRFQKRLAEIAAIGARQEKMEGVRQTNRATNIQERDKLIRSRPPRVGGGASNAPERTVTRETRNAKGEVTGTTVTRTQIGTQKTGLVRVKAPDGRTGTWDLSKGPIPKDFTEIKE